MVKKTRNIVIFLVVFFVLSIWWVFWYKRYIVYRTEREAEEQVKVVNTLVSKNEVTKESCEPILSFDKKLLEIYNDSFNERKFDNLRIKCDEKYNISKAKFWAEFCERLIRMNESDFKEDYIILDTYDDIRWRCIDEFLTVKFSEGIVFDIENDFKTSINLEFWIPFYEDKWDVNSDEFLENRIEAKKRLASLIEVSWWVKLDYEDIILYPTKWIIYLNLQPLKKYKISLKSFIKTSENQKQVFEIEMPENKYFWFKNLDNIALYTQNSLPKFQLLEYNSDKKNTKIKICKVGNESYAKLEFFDSAIKTPVQRNDFFKNGIDKLETIECSEMEIVVRDEGDSWSVVVPSQSPSAEGEGEERAERVRSEWEIGETESGSIDSEWPIGNDYGASSELQKEGEEIKVIKKDFNFDDVLKSSWNGLYYVTFSNSDDREFSGKFQEPVFFWVVNSHITMKVSRNWEAFFFVNDFAWNPLNAQEIKVYLNDFLTKKQKDEPTSSALTKQIYSKEISLWKTWADWVLKVDLKWKIDWAFEKTFSFENDYEENKYDSFFVTSSDSSHQSYVSSKWNSGISPWNFGYTSTSDRWYWTSNNWDSLDVVLNRRWDVEPEFYSHIYTDRRLYLPWEEVNIKWVIRKSTDLSIAQWKEMTVKIKDSKWTEVFNKNLTVNEFGSINSVFGIDTTASLWSYLIYLYSENDMIWKSWFSVEVFKNPKFKNEVSLRAVWLNDWLVKIDKEEKDKDYYWRTNYTWKFRISAMVMSKYYSGPAVNWANFRYKVYRQYYYEDSYWDDCYYGCYWEPQKEFYTEWKWVLDENGKAIFDVDVDFTSSYEDYKYIVEVTVTDKAWDVISWSNSIIAKLPNEYKRRNPDSGIYFTTENRFYKAGSEIVIDWWLNVWKRTEDYDDKFLLIVKRKEYETTMVDDVRWYKRPITRTVERLEKIIKVNSDDFEVTDDGKLKFKYKLEKTSEYVFEFWMIDLKNLQSKKYSADTYINEFNETKEPKIVKDIEKEIQLNYDEVDYLIGNCVWDKDTVCDRKTIYKKLWCEQWYIDDSCMWQTKNIKIKQEIKIDDLFKSDSKKYFTVVAYWDEDASNPVVSDNKITVLSEKISYKLWDKARFLVRLPFSKWKILWTIEKQWVLKSEYLDVQGNTFFREITIDDTFVPNAYVWIVAVDTDTLDAIPEYKVWYTEVVVDKTDKKSFVEIKSNKKQYSPRDEVVLDIDVKDKNKKWVKSELTVMVVDDSLISLMWNVDLNSLEKFYKKLPFQIQTSITNIAMLKRFYFSRYWLAGWGWLGNFKWWDSAVSSRTIFKNTAYFNPSVITDANWKAQVKFNLPDNLTNFRIMVVTNSKDNYFGYWEDFIEVRKNVIIEDKMPFILRDGDSVKLWVNVFNTTKKDMSFIVKLEMNWMTVDTPEKKAYISGWGNEVVYWDVSDLKLSDEVTYKVTALWDSPEYSDSLEWSIDVKQSPILISNIIKSGKIETWKLFDTVIDVPKNTDLDKSIVEVVFSNNRLNGIEKIVKSLAVYPYGCIEQTTSSTYPNAILLKFSDLFSWLENVDVVKSNLKAWVDRIKSMQTSEWGFAYWPWDTVTDLHITPFVLRRLVDMKNYWADIPSDMIEKASKYLENNIWNIDNDIDRAETFLSFAKLWKGQLAYDKLASKIDKNKVSRHTLIAYTYWLVLFDKNKFKAGIESNIEKIKWMLDKEENEYRYWDSLSDKAIFTSMLIDYSYDVKYIDELIDDLYSIDWEGYYYSTQSKNNAFIAFAKYIEIYWKNKNSTFGFSIWMELNRGETFSLWDGNPNMFKMNYKLRDIVYKDKIELWVANLHWTDMFVSLVLKTYPKDKLQVGDSSNGISVKREIYEVMDNGDIKLFEWDEFVKWKLYKVNVSVDFQDEKTRRNVVIEDYLPSAFKVINSEFKTESIDVKQDTTKDNYNGHIEFKPEVVFYNRDVVWWKNMSLEYYFRPEFSWIFTYPPVSAYMMYDPMVKANGKFRVIKVKE